MKTNRNCECACYWCAIEVPRRHDICNWNCVQNSEYPPKIEEWESGLVEIMYGRQYTDIYSKVKTFISELVTQTRLSTIEEAKGCVPDKRDDSFAQEIKDRYMIEYKAGFNDSRSQMLENLNKLSAKNP